MPFYRRRLPHWQPEDASFFVTWRLFGSVPYFKSDDSLSHGSNFARMERALDSAENGPRWLAMKPVADAVEATLLNGAEHLGTYHLRAWVLMPNHVHIVLCPMKPLLDVMRLIKSGTSRAANRVIQRTGTPFWQAESYDHWIRSSAEEEKIVKYIEMNPVRAGLVEEPGAWRWSSAFAGHGPAPLETS